MRLPLFLEGIIFLDFIDLNAEQKDWLEEAIMKVLLERVQEHSFVLADENDQLHDDRQIFLDMSLVDVLGSFLNYVGKPVVFWWQRLVPIVVAKVGLNLVSDVLNITLSCVFLDNHRADLDSIHAEELFVLNESRYRYPTFKPKTDQITEYSVLDFEKNILGLDLSWIRLCVIIS